MEVADESTKKYRRKECELCTDDDEEVRVSISPKRFSLPSTIEKKTKMEIMNRNPYPIYFRACTSNMDAFRTRPNAGRISPNTKSSIVVHFFNSVTPVRRHEEVVIVTSVRPFEQYATQDNVCQYCLQPMNGTKHDHHRKYPFASDENQYIRERSHLQDYKSYSTRQKDEENQYIRGKTIHPDYKSYSKRQKDEEDQYIAEKAHSGEYKNYITHEKYEEEGKYASGGKQEQATADIEERYSDAPLPKKGSSGHQERARDQCKSLLSNDKHELEEICLHAFVHRPRNVGCECGNCFGLSMLDRNDLKVKEIYQALKERRVSDPLPSDTKPLLALSRKEEARLAKEMQKLRDRRVDESKMREREAHILARIIRSRDWVESSDTELSELSSMRDMMKPPKHHPRIISEEKFRKKLEKAKFKKHQKQLEEETKSTTTTEETVPKVIDREKKADAKSEKSPLTKRQRKWTIVAVDEKCNEIVRLSWTNFFLLLCILVALLAIFVFCCNANGGEGMYNIPCFNDLFK